jgi:hypothetical protein
VLAAAGEQGLLHQQEGQAQHFEQQQELIVLAQAIMGLMITFSTHCRRAVAAGGTGNIAAAAAAAPPPQFNDASAFAFSLASSTFRSACSTGVCSAESSSTAGA